MTSMPISVCSTYRSNRISGSDGRFRFFANVWRPWLAKTPISPWRRPWLRWNTTPAMRRQVSARFSSRFRVPNKSVFIFACLCGRQFQKEEKEAFRCPDCGRLLVLEWCVECSEMTVSHDHEHRF